MTNVHPLCKSCHHLRRMLSDPDFLCSTCAARESARVAWAAEWQRTARKWQAIKMYAVAMSGACVLAAVACALFGQYLGAAVWLVGSGVELWIAKLIEERRKACTVMAIARAREAVREERPVWVTRGGVA